MSAETTISISDGKGGTTAPVPVSMMKAAVAATFKSRRPRTRPDPEADAAEAKAYGAAAGELRQFVDRIKRLEGERSDLAEDIQVIFGEAKGRGFDVKALRHVIRLMKQDRDALAEFEAVVDLYRAALQV